MYNIDELFFKKKNSTFKYGIWHKIGKNKAFTVFYTSPLKDILFPIYRNEI